MPKMMSNKIKGLVSKKKKRYQEDGFDLDLSYINDNIIAMGFPAEKLEGVYRNHIDDVVRFLDSKHKNNYKIYNLCTERHYDASKFHGRVVNYPFEDHNPPPVNILKPFCEDVDKWLSTNENNVAAIHCKAGKGRTGVMICAYLLHKNCYQTADEVLTFYGTARTHDCKGVTIPSQRRYVKYYAELVRRGLEYRPTTLLLKSLELSPVPTFNNGTCSPCFVVYKANKKIFTSSIVESKKNALSVYFRVPKILQVSEDIKVVVYNKPKMLKKEKMLQFWLNTFFVEVDQHPTYKGKRTNNPPSNGCTVSTTWTSKYSDKSSNLSPPPREATKLLTFTLAKDQLDKPHKDRTNKLFSSDFKVELQFSKPSEELENSSQTSGFVNNKVGDAYCHAMIEDAPSDNDSDTETEEEEDWEEGTHV